MHYKIQAIKHRPKRCGYKTNSVDRPVKVGQDLRLYSVRASDLRKERTHKNF